LLIGHDLHPFRFKKIIFFQYFSVKVNFRLTLQILKERSISIDKIKKLNIKYFSGAEKRIGYIEQEGKGSTILPFLNNVVLYITLEAT
jgi:hypothetical protein